MLFQKNFSRKLEIYCFSDVIDSVKIVVRDEKSKVMTKADLTNIFLSCDCQSHAVKIYATFSKFFQFGGHFP